jgi:hypothetical protein
LEIRRTLGAGPVAGVGESLGDLADFSLIGSREGSLSTGRPSRRFSEQIRLKSRRNPPRHAGSDALGCSA